MIRSDTPGACVPMAIVSVSAPPVLAGMMYECGVMVALSPRSCCKRDVCCDFNMPKINVKSEGKETHIGDTPGKQFFIVFLQKGINI